MREVMATANLADGGLVASDDPVTAVLPRREFEAALHGNDPVGLWFDLTDENDGGVVRLTVELSSADAHEALRRSTAGDVAVTLDGGSLTELYDHSDVEAHGMRGALAIAVTVAAVAAPAGLAAKPQVAGTALKPQTARTAVKPQVARTDLKPQVARTDLKPQVARTALKPQVVRSALKPQVARTDLRAQVVNRDVTRPMVRLVVTAAGVNAWR